MSAGPPGSPGGDLLIEGDDDGDDPAVQQIVGGRGQESPWRLLGLHASAVAAFDEGEWLDLLNERGVPIATARLVNAEAPGRGLFLCARAVFPAMKAQGKGTIINISSSTFFKGVPHYIHYTTSKGGVVGFTRSLARELGEFGIRVNAIAPGFTLSGENESNISEERKQENVRSRMLKRAEVPQDLVGTFVFLASDDSDFITGQTLLVDGGGSVH